MYSLPGTYSLIFLSAIEKPISIGKLGTLALAPGFYVYIGSAFGPGGLKARIKHHRNPTSRRHWHIDYLAPILTLSEIWHTNDQIHREHHWAEIHSQTKGAVQPLPGFGSSDCRCLSHLFYYQRKPSGHNFRRKIRAKFDGHARLMIENKPLRWGKV